LPSFYLFVIFNRPISGAFKRSDELLRKPRVSRVGGLETVAAALLLHLSTIQLAMLRSWERGTETKDACVQIEALVNALLVVYFLR